MSMIAYVISLLIGLLVGVFYGIIGIRSPAPPIIALLGLLGILLGEQIPSITRNFMTGNNNAQKDQVVEEVLYDQVDKSKNGTEDELYKRSEESEK